MSDRNPEAKASPKSAESSTAAAKESAEKKKEAPPARQLPSQEEIAAFVKGEDVPTIGTLFEELPTKKFDIHVTMMQKQELLPQHWQVIRRLDAPPDDDFDRLPEVARLRRRYTDPDLAVARLDALRAAWRELRGKQPTLWTVPDLLAALRRIIDREREVDFTHLLTAVRDVWLGLTVPHGETQLDLLWSCLSLVRERTKK